MNERRAILTMRDGHEVPIQNATDHSIRLLWEEDQTSYENWSYRWLDADFTNSGDFPYDLHYRGSSDGAGIVLRRGWELAITHVFCTDAWGSIDVEYNHQHMRISGGRLTLPEGEDLVRPWIFRESLPAVITYHPGPRLKRDSRRAQITLSGLLIKEM